MEDDRSEQPQVATTRELEPRGVLTIINEALVIYLVRFRPLIALNLIAHLPVAILPLLPVDIGPFFLTANFISTVVVSFAAAATIYMVCQHYVLGRISIGVCYARTLWRAISITILGVISAIMSTAFFAVAPLAEEVNPESVLSLQISLIFVLLIVLLIISVYMAMATPAVIVEGFRPVGMIRRSFRLVRRSEIRIFFNLLMYVIVAMGMAIVLMLPIGIIAAVVSGGPEMSGVGETILGVGQAVISILIPPLIYTALALLYFDIRVRKEGFTLAQLAREMGVATEQAGQTDIIETEYTETTETEEQDDSDSARDG